MSVSYKPAAHSTVTPYLLVDDPAMLLGFLRRAFDAKELERQTMPDGRVAHAEVKVYDCVLMIGGARDEWKAMPAALYVYVKDTEAVYRAALAAGATSLMEPADQVYGHRTAGVRDPSGNLWWIATHIEDVSPDEVARRLAARS